MANTKAKLGLAAMPGSANPMLAIAAAWLDAELFMRCGDTRCQHSTRLLGYRPHGVESASRAREADLPNDQARHSR